jgi:hypothetical protein
MLTDADCRSVTRCYPTHSVQICFECVAETSQASVPLPAPSAWKLLAAGVAAAALISTGPAHAGVKLEKSVVKKVRKTRGLFLPLPRSGEHSMWRMSV